MKLDGYLRAQELMTVQRPPELWEAATEETPFVRLLGELIVLGLRGGAPVERLVLNAAHVTVGIEAATVSLPAGDYVAITIRGPGAWSSDASWAIGMPVPGEPLRCLPPVIEAARGRYAYARDLGPEGSVTVLLDRLEGSAG